MGEVTNLIVVSNPIGNTECQRCGGCCKNIVLKQKFNDEMNEWFQARGCALMPDGSIAIPFQCPHLKKKIYKDSILGPTLTNEYECDIYETRPEVCKDYRCWK